MRQKLLSYVRAGYAGLYITSWEEARVEAEIRAVAKERDFKLHVWSVTQGVIDVTDADAPVEIPDTQDPLAMLEAFTKLDEKSILVARDFHGFLADPNPLLYRKVKDALAIGKASNRVLIILGCVLKLPPELEKEVTVIEFKLPDRDQLKIVLDAIAKSAGVELNGNTDPILDAASGLTSTEAENAFALSVVEAKDILPEIVAREKAETVKKNGLLEIVSTKITLDEIGGLENLKADLFSKRNLFTKEAKEYGLPSPRPLLCVGQAGTGKTMTATATATVFNLPLLRLEAGRLFGSLVGESERNWRTAFATAKAIAPCIVHCDEIDGLFAGAESSGKTDGGTALRVIKAILQDLQFNAEGIFFVFTANDIDNLPDPLIDRCDVWSVDLPTQQERESIWSIHIAKRGRKPKKFNLPELARLTEGFSGRQIEQVWLRAMTFGFNKHREPTEKDVEEAAASCVATSITMKDAIERRRARLKNRAQAASRTETATAATGRRLA